MLSRCRIVLVRTHFAGNLGAVARSMSNFGLADLVLVEPFTRPDNPEARRLARHGLDILQNARTVTDIGEAMDDCVYALASSASAGGTYRQTFVGTPEEQLPRLVESMTVGPGRARVRPGTARAHE